MSAGSRQAVHEEWSSISSQSHRRWMGNDQKQYVFVTTDHVCHYLKEKSPFKRLTIRIKIMTSSSSSFSHTRGFNGLHKKAPLKLITRPSNTFRTLQALFLLASFQYYPPITPTSPKSFFFSGPYIKMYSIYTSLIRYTYP